MSCSAAAATDDDSSSVLFFQTSRSSLNTHSLFRSVKLNTMSTSLQPLTVTHRFCHFFTQFCCSLFLHNTTQYYTVSVILTQLTLTLTTSLHTDYIVLSGVMLIMPATEPKVHWLKSSSQKRILRAIKIRSTTSFGGEVKPSARCRKILRHVKEPKRYEKRYL
jgi:hypothetical protein